MNKLIKKHLLPLVLLTALIVSVYPSNASAVGFNITLSGTSHWGTSPVQTGYPYLVFDVKQSYGEGLYKVETLNVYNTWVPVTNTYILQGSTTHTFKVAVDGPNQLYRVFVQTVDAPPTKIDITYRGSR